MKTINCGYKAALLSLLVFLLSFFPVVLKAQNSGQKLVRYASPNEIDPVNINYDNLGTEDFKSLRLTANISYELGNYSEAAKIYLYIINRNADDCESYYQLARCYAQMEMPGKAVDFLIMAINAGYNNFNNINREKAFKSLREDPNVEERIAEIVQYGSDQGITAYFPVTKMEKCRLFLPRDWNSEREYPLVIGLHGNGGNATEFSGLWDMIKDQEVIFVVAESPYNYSTNGGALTQAYTWGIPEQDAALWEAADPLVTKYISGIATWMQKEYKISNTLLLGFSQGAAYAYATGIRYQDIIDGIICFGGRLPSVEDYPYLLSPEELEEENDLRVFIAHGETDEAINISQGRRSMRTLNKLNYDTKFRSFEGGHYVPGDVLVEAIKWHLLKD